MERGIALVVRRRIKAPVQRVFDAWTQPEQLRVWWGPRPVTCSDAEVDLRVGGRYRIVNALPDGTSLAIYGEFRVVDAPRELAYTWCTSAGEASLVRVRFEPHGEETDVVIVHESIPDEAVRKSHAEGWRACLDGLERHFPAP